MPGDTSLTGFNKIYPGLMRMVDEEGRWLEISMHFTGVPLAASSLTAASTGHPLRLAALVSKEPARGRYGGSQLRRQQNSPRIDVAVERGIETRLNFF